MRSVLTLAICLVGLCGLARGESCDAVPVGSFPVPNMSQYPEGTQFDSFTNTVHLPPGYDVVNGVAVQKRTDTNFGRRRSRVPQGGHGFRPPPPPPGRPEAIPDDTVPMDQEPPAPINLPPRRPEPPPATRGPTLRDYQDLKAEHEKLKEELQELQDQLSHRPEPVDGDDLVIHQEILEKLGTIAELQRLQADKLAGLAVTIIKDENGATLDIDVLVAKLKAELDNIAQQQPAPDGPSPEVLEKLEKIQEALTQIKPGIDNAAIEQLQQRLNELANVPKALELLVAQMKDQNNHLANTAVAVDQLNDGQQRFETALTAIIQNDISASTRLDDVLGTLKQLEERKPDNSKLDDIATTTQRVDNELDQVLKELEGLNKDADAAAERDKELSYSLKAMGLRLQRSEQRIEKLTEESNGPRGKMNLRLWVDPKTGRPLRLEPREQ